MLPLIAKALIMYISEDIINVLIALVVLGIIIFIYAKRKNYRDTWDATLRKTGYDYEFQQFRKKHPNLDENAALKQFLTKQNRAAIYEERRKQIETDRKVEEEKNKQLYDWWEKTYEHNKP